VHADGIACRMQMPRERQSHLAHAQKYKVQSSSPLMINQ